MNIQHDLGDKFLAVNKQFLPAMNMPYDQDGRRKSHALNFPSHKYGWAVTLMANTNELLTPRGAPSLLWGLIVQTVLVILVIR